MPWAGRNLDDILGVQQERTVGNDCRYGTRSVNTVRYEQRILQIPPDQHRHHYVKCKVRVHTYPDGSLAVFHGPRCLARYDADGDPINQEGAMLPAA